MKKKKSSPKASKEGSVYEEAHKRATYQPPMREELLNSLGKRVIDSSEASSAKWYIFNPHIQQFEPIQTFP